MKSTVRARHAVGNPVEWTSAGWRRAVIDRRFDLESFYTRVRAKAKERNALRHDLVRGLKDYYEAIYGYDRYGAETVFHLAQRMSAPYVYGFAVLRILHDRRISDPTKHMVAGLALDVAEYGTDLGLPFGLYGVLQFLAQQDALSLENLRYGLVITAGQDDPFHGVEKGVFLDFFRHLLASDQMPVAERAFWAHSLIARHPELTGTADLIAILLGSESVPVEIRRELAQAWISFRQPRLTVEMPPPSESRKSRFVEEHLPFWIAHAPSWPSGAMMRHGLVWLARLGEDPVSLARTYIGYNDTYAEQVHAAVADIIAEHHARMPEAAVKSIIERGIALTGSSPTRRRFYRLGADLFGSEYLRRAATDTANSVRQWAARQMAEKL